jgi:hypothetical protein
MPDLRQRPRFLEGQQVINACKAWQPEYKALLVQAFQAGCELRRTSGQHVMISNDLGMTTTIANGGNRRGNKSLRKYQNDTGKVIEGQKMADMTASTEVTGTDAGAPEATPPVPTSIGAGLPAREFYCDLHDGAPLKYRTQEQLDTHRESFHWQCPQCQKWIPKKSGAGGHTAIKHGKGVPWKHKRNYKGPASNGTKTSKPGTVSELLEKTQKPKSGVNIESQEGRGVAVSERPTPGRRTETVELPDNVLPDSDLALKIAEIRVVLGDDPRLATLTAERDEWKKRAEDAETKLTLLDGLAAQIRETASL